GFDPVTYHILPDKVGCLATALRQASMRYDVILLTGGMSVGKYDLVRQTIEQIGAKVRLHGVAMKPGKPFLFATLPGNRTIFGLPGNPLSALTGLHEFVLPALRRMSGMNPQACRPCLRLPLGSGLTSKGGRARYILGRLSLDETMSCVVPVASRSSADLVSAGRADGAIVVPANVTRLRAGEIVEFRPWRALS
ncbi:MAG: molybdopterin-binding protein, partial [Kiritimatiellota bacterium]|nr:molybdopterin-binding protein [Kiritimatiellota bacterium]